MCVSLNRGALLIALELSFLAKVKLFLVIINQYAATLATKLAKTQ